MFRQVQKSTFLFKYVYPIFEGFQLTISHDCGEEEQRETPIIGQISVPE